MLLSVRLELVITYGYPGGKHQSWRGHQYWGLGKCWCSFSRSELKNCERFCSDSEHVTAIDAPCMSGKWLCARPNHLHSIGSCGWPFTFYYEIYVEHVDCTYGASDCVRVICTASAQTDAIGSCGWPFTFYYEIYVEHVDCHPVSRVKRNEDLPKVALLSTLTCYQSRSWLTRLQGEEVVKYLYNWTRTRVMKQSFHIDTAKMHRDRTYSNILLRRWWPCGSTLPLGSALKSANFTHIALIRTTFLKISLFRTKNQI